MKEVAVGDFPVGLKKASRLTTLNASSNNFSGFIPEDLGNVSSLETGDLREDSLGGDIPAELGRLKLLNTIFLYKNKFEDKISPEIGNKTSLVQLDLSDNMLSGAIQTEISQLKNLQLLNFMRNWLSGLVPSGLGDLPQLEVLELWNNSLSGKLPSNLGKNSPLQWLDVSSNALSGAIPETLYTKGYLTKLILFNNFFLGPIPASLSTSSEGPVPENGVLKTINSNDLVGNAALCGGVLPLHVVKPRHIHQGMRAHAQGTFLLDFTVSDILSCIKERNMIGMGATGVVYKAEIPQSSKMMLRKNETVSMIAGSCGYIALAKFPKDRPSMRDVIMMLREAKPRRKSGRSSEIFAANKGIPFNGLL
ncbi:hypothetical protein Fmac_027771 [Flemingia macrophylla]|uniref:Uncharacterized protein n=1 Tax=Flemingia macrophylla TaxID=520843 RepID=A0ABD1LIP1_9FABA